MIKYLVIVTLFFSGSFVAPLDLIASDAPAQAVTTTDAVPKKAPSIDSSSDSSSPKA